MEPIVIGVLGLACLLAALFLGVPIGMAMGLVGALGFAVLMGLEAALGVLQTVPYTTFANFDLSVIPLFILMGTFAFTAGLSTDLFSAVYAWLGQFRGGVAHATVVACACFAAISGSSLATAATLGAVALPEMKKYRYDEALATGSIAAGGSVGILIPPSVILIIYGIITEQSIGKLFLAGFIPGILEAGFYVITIMLLTKLKPQLGPPGPRHTMREKVVALKDAWQIAVLFVLVIGGIYQGIFTPTEAASVGAFGAFFFAVAKRRMGPRKFYQSLSGTMVTTGMLFLIILGAMIFGYFLTVTGVSSTLASTVVGMNLNRYVILVAILAVTLFLGCMMDSMAIVLLTTPVFFPVIQDLGFDPIWFGILMVRITEMGLITPPVGLNVFIIAGISNVPIGKIFKGIVPFLIADLCEVILLILVPEIVLLLPNLMD